MRWMLSAAMPSIAKWKQVLLLQGKEMSERKTLSLYTEDTNRQTT